MYSNSNSEKIFRIFNGIFLIFVCIVTAYPFIYMIVLSLNEGLDAAKGGVYLIPRKFTLFNYRVVLANPNMVDSYIITIGRTLLGTLVSLIVTGLAAYGISTKKIPGKNVIITFIMIPFVFSGGLVPFYLQLRNLKLLNTFWVYIFPYAFNIWNMFVMKKFFEAIPYSIRDSAYIDGASELKVLLRIILPLSLPVIAAIGLFVAVWHWNEWFSGAFFVRDTKLIPVQTYLQQMLTAEGLRDFFGRGEGDNIDVEGAIRVSHMSQLTLRSVKMSAVIVGTIPILLAYPFLQKYFIKGVLIGSIKG